MNILDTILVTDTNVIIHLEKVDLLNEFVNDNRIRIADVVFFQEYEKNGLLKDTSKIKLLTLNEKQIREAYELNEFNSRNTIYDYCSYILARDNDYTLLTGDWKLKKYIGNEVSVVGVIGYVLDLQKKKIISKDKLLKTLKLWLDDDEVYLPSDILEKAIREIEEGKDNGN